MLKSSEKNNDKDWSQKWKRVGLNIFFRIIEWKAVNYIQLEILDFLNYSDF